MARKSNHALGHKFRPANTAKKLANAKTLEDAEHYAQELDFIKAEIRARKELGV